MIDNVVGGSPYLTVGSYSGSTYVNGYAGQQGVGNMRYNTSSQKMEVYDGSIWINISQTATVGLSMPAEEAIRWVQDKMEEERSLKKRLEKHPGLKDAYEKFQVMDILCKQEEEAK